MVWTRSIKLIYEGMELLTDILSFQSFHGYLLGGLIYCTRSPSKQGEFPWSKPIAFLVSRLWSRGLSLVEFL